MTKEILDYCVLGDTQPEGLFLAAGLARKGARVGIVPSASLGELPPQEALPTRLPEKIGKRRLDDLLFQVGFFRLEESGLEAQELITQYLLPRHRISLDGKRETWVREYQREFSGSAKKILDLRESLSGEINMLRSRGFPQLLNRQIGEPSIRRLIEMEASEGRPEVFDGPDLRFKKYRSLVEKWSSDQNRVYRSKQKSNQPFHQFLLEHCRKWGVIVLEDDFQLKQKWGGYQVGSLYRSKNLIINSLAAMKHLAKNVQKSFELRPSHWLYFERLNCSEDLVPEPLAEWSLMDFKSEDSELPVVLHIERNRLKDQSYLTLGTWLSFDDSSEWRSQIQKSRDSLKKVVAFLPDHSFQKFPSVLELNEMKGETVRRGELDRLGFKDGYQKTLVANFMGTIQKRLGFSYMGSFQLSKRIYVSAAYLIPGRYRKESLSDCLKFIESQERRMSKKKAA